MHNNSIPLFRLDGKPVLTKQARDGGGCFAMTVRDDSDPGWTQGVDFYVDPVYTDRLERAVAAFNAAMQEEG